MARGSIKKHCMCRDEQGREIRGCKKPHGSWGFIVDAGPDPETGKRRQVRRKGYRSRDEAAEAMTRELAAIDAGVWTDDGGSTLGAWLDQWLAALERAGRSPKTLAYYRGHVRDVWKPQLGRYRLRDLRRHHVERVLAELGEPVKPAKGKTGRKVTVRSAATLDGYRRTLRAALSAARAAGRITVNVAEGPMLSLPARRSPELEFWDLAETARFLEHVAPHDWSALFEVAAYAGLRRGELLGLRWTDLDGDEAGLTVRQTVVELASKDIPLRQRACPVCLARAGAAARFDELVTQIDDRGTSETRRGALVELVEALLARVEHPGILIKAPKSSAGVRWVPLVERAQAALVGQRLAQAEHRRMVGPGYADHGLIFAMPDGTPIRPGRVTEAHHEQAAAAGLAPIRLHDMRHGACSLLLSGGVPIEIVSQILGHGDVTVTRKIYAHILREITATQVGQAAKLLDEHRPGRRPASPDRRDRSVTDSGPSEAKPPPT